MASEQPERRPKLIDLNLLPPEYLPRKISRLSIVLVTVLVAMVCLLPLFVYLMVDANSDVSSLGRKLDGLEEKAQGLRALGLPAEASALNELIEEAESKLEAITGDYETFRQNLIGWYEKIEEIDDALPGTRVTLESIEQGEASDSMVTIELTGTATKVTYIRDYALALDEYEHFSATINSMEYSESDDEWDFVIVVTLESEGSQ